MFTPRWGVCMIRSMTEKRSATLKSGTYRLLSKLPNLFTTAQALALGIPRVTLHRLEKRGEITSITRGLYKRRAGRAFDLDLAEIAIKIPRATICLTSALAEYGLTDAIPARMDIAIPRGTRAPKTRAAVNWHRFDSGSFDWERNKQGISDTELAIGIYSAERTLADLARHPQKDQAELVEGIRRWLRRAENNPAKLLRAARELPGAEIQMRRILEILT